MAGLLKNLGTDHLVYVHQLNLQSDTLLLVQLDQADIENHSFLDQRVFRQEMNYEWVDWAEFEAAAEPLPKEIPGYIFHIGHCGSTLLSRLVSAASGTHALREPLPLRAIAVDQAYGRAAMLGFVIGVLTEALTGQGIIHQIGLGPLVDGYAACSTKMLPFCF